MSHHRPAPHPELASLIGAAVLAIPVGEQVTLPAGELVRLTASVSGEIQVGDIPVSAGVDLDALKAGDTSPLEVVVVVPAGRSKRGWDYRAEALQKIVGEVMTSGLPGFLGHQKAENVDTEFPQPVTHWVGAKWENGKAFFRGVIDSSAPDLKRWVKSKTIRQVSIFGRPTLRQVGGETHVVDYAPLSIDWTPLNRAGMPTSVVALAGEIDSIAGASGSTSTQPGAGSTPPARRNDRMTLEELLAELRKLKANPAQVLGEMGWQPKDIITALNLPADQLAPQVVGEQWATFQAEHAALGEIATAFGLTDAKPADVVTAAKAAHTAQQAAATAARTATVDKVIGEMVSVEAVRPVVRELVLPKLATDADEAAIKVVVGEIAGLDHIKRLLGGTFGHTAPIAPVQAGNAPSAGGQSGTATGAGASAAQTNPFLVTRRTAIG